MNPLAHAIASLVALIPVHANTWPLANLDKELRGIAMLESSYGQNVDHKQSVYGPFYTAYGSLGLKPSTAYDMYSRFPALQAKYPELTDKSAFLNRFWSDPALYKEFAEFHWHYLRTNTSSLRRAAYSWRYGLTAQMNSKDEVVGADEYVVKYMEPKDLQN